MNTKQLLAEVRKEITRLQKVVSLLEGSRSTAKRGGRGKKRKLSAAARKAIGDAQRARWAKARKQKDS